MLLPTNGSRLFVKLPPQSWIEVAEFEFMGGGLGGEWQKIEVASLRTSGAPEEPAPEVLKGMMRRAPISFVLGLVLSDPGQLALWTAYHSTDAADFRLIFSDGNTTREWSALVFSMEEVLDGANNVLRLQVGLERTTQIAKGVLS